MTTTMMIITTATLVSAVVGSVTLFYLGLRLGLKVGSKSREPLYPTPEDSGVIEQEYSE